MAFGNQFVCSSLGKATYPSLSLPQLPIILSVGWRPHGIFPVLFGMSIGVVHAQLLSYVLLQEMTQADHILHHKWSYLFSICFILPLVLF